MFLEKKKDTLSGWLPKFAIIFFINLFLLIGVYSFFKYYYRDRIYPGVYAAEFDLGGKTYGDAWNILNQKIKVINNDGVPFSYAGDQIAVYPIISKNDSAYEIITFDPDESIKKALGYGREGNEFIDLKDILTALIFGHNVPMFTKIDTEAVRTYLAEEYSHYEIPAKDASLVYNHETDKFSIQGEESGKVIDYARGINSLQLNLENLDNSEIELYSVLSSPRVYEKDCGGMTEEAKQILKNPLVLKYGDQEWKIKKQVLASWLALEKNYDQNKVEIFLNQDAISDYLNNTIAPILNKEPINAKFQIDGTGKIIAIQSNKDGLELNVASSSEEIGKSVLDGNYQVELAVDTAKSIGGPTRLTDLGIKEIIGTGESNFSGSPKNRIHNINVGANTLDGMLIKPNEEFSLVKALGEIDKATGYLPELVIKDNKTVPDYGGGLCQIATTMFRAALNTGLPITERQNHSYRVSYYEPAGTDATIYDPSPDLRFINDTGNYILIQSRIEGTKIYFDMWGTKDGRKVEETAPTIYNIVKPKPPKITETLDLPPGEMKCTELAHNGADAYFNYTVAYPGGDIKKRTFYSHYVPWQKVCLLGVKQLSTPTSTPENATSTSN